MQVSLPAPSSIPMRPSLKKETIQPRVGADNNSNRRHLTLNPEAFAPTPPEYLAPWLFFGKPNNQPSSSTGTTGIGTGASTPQIQPASTVPADSIPPSDTELRQPQPTDTSPISPPVVPAPSAASEAMKPSMDDIEGSSASPPTADEPQPAPEADAKAGLPQEKDKPLIVRGFDNSVIRNLNRRLEDPDWQKRAEASNDFSMILGANPNLERKPAYKPYIDAFMLKILRDSSAVVHEPALRSIQVGYYRHPTPAVLEELNVLKTSIGLFGLEPQMVTDALYSLYSYQQQEQEEAKIATQKKQAQKSKFKGGVSVPVPQTQLVS